MDSRITKEKECFLTGSTNNLDRHHLFFGANRKLADEDGLWIWLEHYHHIADSPCKTPHNCRELDLELKKLGQMIYEREIGTRDEFMKRYGRNYL